MVYIYIYICKKQNWTKTVLKNYKQQTIYTNYKLTTIGQKTISKIL